MKLHEYQAKSIFSEYGIKVPRGKLAKNLEEVKRIVEELEGKVILKSQVHTGGRGKAGGIKKAESVEEALEHAKNMFGKCIHGLLVNKIYIEELIDVERELYLGFTYDGLDKSIVMLMSSFGGINIEEIVTQHPEKIVRKKIDPLLGFWDFLIREALYELEIPKKFFKPIASIAKKLYYVFKDYEAELCEINPLAVTRDGNVYALDARLNIDDDALYRHTDLIKLKDYSQMEPLEKIAQENGLKYVKLDGNVGLIAAGAGMGMATADYVYIFGGRPANFFDIGGATPEIVKKSFELILQDSRVRVIYVNVLGGLTRCDWIAKGLIEAFNNLKIRLPVVIRLSGTNEDEGRETLTKYINENGLEDVYIIESMEDGAKKAVEISIRG